MVAKAVPPPKDQLISVSSDQYASFIIALSWIYAGGRSLRQVSGIA